jgi:hypothetical protein
VGLTVMDSIEIVINQEVERAREGVVTVKTQQAIFEAPTSSSLKQNKAK